MAVDKVKNTEIATLEVSSWIGSIGAEHYYGSIRCYNSAYQVTVHDIKHPMTKHEAYLLNKKDGYGSDWQAGELTNRYDTTERIERDAIKYFTEHLESLGCKLLVKGRSAVAQPQPVIASAKGYEQIAATINDLYTKGQAVKWSWEKDEKLLSALCDEWNGLIEYE